MKKKRWMNRHPFSLLICAVIVVWLAVRIFLPTVILHYLNKEIERSENIAGKIEDLQLGIILGKVVFKDIHLEGRPKKDFELNVARAELDLQWWSLLTGKFKVDVRVGDVLLVLNMGTPSKKDDDKDKKDENIKEAYQKVRREFRATLPTYLSSLEINPLNVRIVDQSDMALPIFRILDTRVLLEELSNRPEKQDEPSKLVFEGRTSGKGKFAGYFLFSGVESNPGLKAQMQLSHMDLRFLNPFFRKNANLDLESGQLDFFVEFAMRDWQVDGYVKPMLSEIKFIDLDKKKEKGFWRVLWEQLLTFVAWILKNEKTDQIAAKIRFSGRLDGPDTNPASAFATLIRNAFIEAIQSGFDRDLKIKPRLTPKKTP